MNHHICFKTNNKRGQHISFSFFVLFLILCLIVQLLPIRNVTAQSISSSITPISSNDPATESTETQVPLSTLTETAEPTTAFTETPELAPTFTDTPVPTFAPSETLEPTFTPTQTTEPTLTPSISTEPAHTTQSTNSHSKESSPIVAGGLVIIETGSAICAYNISEQTLTWCYSDLASIENSGVADNVLVIIGQNEKTKSVNLVGIDPGTGFALWQIDLGLSTNLSYACSNISAEKLYCGIGSTLTAIDLSTQKALWNNTSLSGNVGSLNVFEDKIFVGSDTGTFYALSTSDGHIIWQISFMGNHPIGFGNEVVVNNVNGSLYALNASDGTEMWNREIQGNPNCPITYGSNALIVASTQGTIERLDPQNGQTIWNYDSGLGEMDGCPLPTIGDDNVYANLSDGTVKGFNLANGSLDWQQTILDQDSLSQWKTIAPAFSDKKLIVVFTNGKILDFNSFQKPVPTSTGEPTAADTATPVVTQSATETLEPTISLPSIPNPAKEPVDVLTLSSISPLYAFVNGPSFNLTVNGSGFDSNTAVYWNGEIRTTTFVNSTQLIAQVNNADIATINVNPIPITVISSSSPEVTSNPLPFTILKYSPTYGQKLSTNKVSFSWDNIIGSHSPYILQLSLSKTFSTTILNQSINGTSYAFGTALTNGKTYYWRIRPSTKNSWSPTWQFFSMNPPVAPYLSSPLNATITNDNTPDFSWKAASNGDSSTCYQIQISKSTTFSTPVQNVTLSAGILAYTASKLNDGTYYWRIRGIDSVGVLGTWSAVHSFSIDTIAPAVPSLSAPAKGAVVQTTIPTLSISAVTGANRYQFQVDVENDFATPLVNITQTATSCTLVNKQALPFGVVYWRARSIDAAGNVSGWSTIRSFTVNILISPANLSYSTNQNPTFSWAKAGTGTLTYEIQVDTTNDFSSTTLTLDKTQVATNSYTTSKALQIGVYYWRVRILPSIGNSNNWTPVWSFIVTKPLPAAPILSTPASGFLFYDNTPSLVWKPATGTFSNYKVQISPSTSFSVITQDATIPKGTTAYNTTALPNGIYYWRVKAVNSFGISGPWSATRYFSIKFISPNHNSRFGITAPNGITGYPINTLGISSYLDWGMNVNPPNIPGISYIQTVRLRDSNCNYILDPASPALANVLLTNVTSIAIANPGSYWLIGNEPDTSFKDPNGNCQDNLTPAQYATAYQTVYTAIKSADPNAKIGIGTIVEPTALRMKYLDLVYAAYKNNYGINPPSDFWSIHSFILPENSSWGTGIPAGMSTYSSLAVNYTVSQTIDVTIFEQRLLAFRKWMAAKGEQNKPLWITEYGSLFPSDSSGGLQTVPITSTSSFMLATFKYLQTATDLKYGDPNDNYHLVQKWYWYSLNDSQAKMGGGLYDPNNNKARTIIGDAFINYVVTH